MDFDLAGWNVQSVVEDDDTYLLTMEVTSPSSSCPSCGNVAYRHGMGRQLFIDVPLHGKRVGLLVHKQRYRCKECRRSFMETLPEMDEVRSMTRRLRVFIEQEALKRSFVSIADEVGVHEKTVRIIFREYLIRQGQEVKSDEGESLGAVRKRLVTRAQTDLTKETSKLCEQPAWYHCLSKEQSILPRHVVTALTKRYEIACRLADLLGAHRAVSSVLVFGSVASGAVDERSDVDLLVVCRPDILPIAERRNLLSLIGSDWLFGDQSNENPLFADIDVDGSIEGVFVSVHYQTASWITRVLREVFDGGAMTTKTMAFRPYTLPGLLQRGWLLLDKKKDVRKWRERAQVFPRQLKMDLLRHFAPVLRENVEELVANAERNLGPRAFIFHLNWGVDALTSILFALNEVYDPADRRTERTILPTLEKVPKNFLSALTEVLEGPFDDAGALYRARLFRQLATEVLDMAETEML